MVNGSPIEVYWFIIGQQHFSYFGWSSIRMHSTQMNFVKQLGNMVKMATGEPRSTIYIKQRIGIAIQRSNAARVMGTFDASAKLDEIYYILSDNF